MKKKKKDAKDEITLISIKVGSFDVRSEAAINLNLMGNNTLFSRDEDTAFEHVTSLQISGKCTDPANRLGDEYKITIIGGEPHAGWLSATLEDFHARDENNIPVYKTHRGQDYPVYNPPKGLARLSKKRGEPIWDAWVYVAPHLVSDMLMSLMNRAPLYLSILEQKHGRDRWIQSISLQSIQPEDE